MQREVGNFFKPFYSSAFYVDLIRNWRGIGIGFILVLTFIDLTQFAVVGGKVLPGVNQIMTQTAEQMPKVTINEGVLSIDRPSPYIITQQNSKTIVFDTSDAAKDMGAVTNALERDKVGIYVTSDFFAYKKSNSIELQRFDKPGLKNLIIDHDRWVSTIALIVQWGGPVIFLITALVLLLITFLITVVKALVVQLAALFFKNKPSFSGAMRLAAAAAIPPVTILTVFEITRMLSATPPQPGEIASQPFHIPVYVSFIVWLLFALFGLWSNNRTPKADAEVTIDAP